jgi:hypothetical protein
MVHSCFLIFTWALFPIILHNGKKLAFYRPCYAMAANADKITGVPKGPKAANLLHISYRRHDFRCARIKQQIQLIQCSVVRQSTLGFSWHRVHRQKSRQQRDCFEQPLLCEQDSLFRFLPLRTCPYLPRRAVSSARHLQHHTPFQRPGCFLEGLGSWRATKPDDLLIAGTKQN